MMCLIQGGQIMHGPSSVGGIMPVLFGLGYTLEDGTLLTAGGEPVELPTNPVQSVTLGEGISIFPAVLVEDDAPEGKILAGREPVILPDRVELRPVWADAPPPPAPAPLPELTKLQFLARFTDEEKVLLKSLEATDPTVALFWEEYRTADSIRLDDPRVIRGLTYLASQEHITEARKLEILEGA